MDNIAPKTEEADETQQQLGEQHQQFRHAGYHHQYAGTPVQQHIGIVPQPHHNQTHVEQEHLHRYPNQMPVQAVHAQQMAGHHQHIQYQPRPQNEHGHYVQQSQHPLHHHPMPIQQNIHPALQAPQQTIQGHAMQGHSQSPQPMMARSKRTPADREDSEAPQSKRKCVSSACKPCRKRKSKCDGGTPNCSTCTAVYGTPCEYDYEGDHRRKGAYKRDLEDLKKASSSWKGILECLVNPRLSLSDVSEVGRILRTLGTEKADEAHAAVLSKIGSPKNDGTCQIQAPQWPLLKSLTASKEEIRFQLSEDGELRFCGQLSTRFFMPRRRPENIQYEFRLGPNEWWTRVATVSKDRQMHLIQMFFTWVHPNYTMILPNLFKNCMELRKGRYCTRLLFCVVCCMGAVKSEPEAQTNDNLDQAQKFWMDALFWFKEEGHIVNVANVAALGLMAIRCAEDADWEGAGNYLSLACDMSNQLGLQTCLNEKEGELVSIDYRRFRQVCFWGLCTIDAHIALFTGTPPRINIQATDQINFKGDAPEDIWYPYPENQDVVAIAARTHATAALRDRLVVITNELLTKRLTLGNRSGLFLTRVYDEIYHWRDSAMGGHLNPNGSVLTPGGLEAHILSLIVTLQLVSPFINCKLPGVNLPLMNCIQHTIGPMSLLFDSYFRCSRMNYRRAGPLITHGLHQLAITCLLVYNLAQGRTFFRYACVHLQLIAPYQKHARVALQFLNYAATEINMELDQIVLDILGRNRPNGFPGIEQVQAGRCRQAGIHLIAYPIEDNAQEQHPAVRQHMLQQQQHQMHTEHVQQQQQGINGAYLKPEPRSPQNDLLHLDTEEDSNFLAARHGLAEGSVTPGYHTHDPASGEPLHRVQLNPAQAHAHAQAQAQRRHHDQAHHAQSQVLAAHRAAEEAAHRNIEPLDPDNSIFAGEWAMNIGLSEDAPALDEPDHDSDGQEVNGNNGRFGLGRHTSSSPKAAEAQMMAAQAAGTATDADADAEGEEESPVDENAYDALFNDTIGDYQE